MQMIRYTVPSWRRKRQALIGWLTAITVVFASMIVAQAKFTPAHADDPSASAGCVDENSDPLVEIYDAYFNNVDVTNGYLDWTQPWYYAHYLTYRKAFLDLQLLNGSDPDDWLVYVVMDTNGAQSINWTSHDSPSAPAYTTAGGAGPEAWVQTAASPNTASYSPVGSITAAYWHSADFADKMWMPRSNQRQVLQDAINQSNKRIPLGIGLIYKPDWPGTYNYTDQLSLPRNGPTSTTNTPITTGFVGVNSPTQCAFYFGTQLWSNSYTTADTPQAGTTDDCDTSSTSQPRHEVEQLFGVEPWDSPDPGITSLYVTAHVFYTWCDMGNDDYTDASPNPPVIGGNVLEDSIRLNSVYFCWRDEDKPWDFEGVDFTAHFDEHVVDPNLSIDMPTVEMDSGGEDHTMECSDSYDLRSSIFDGNGDGGVWWLMNDLPFWTVDALYRENFASDTPFSFLSVGDPYPDYAGVYLDPADARSVVGPAY